GHIGAELPLDAGTFVEGEPRERGDERAHQGFTPVQKGRLEPGHRALSCFPGDRRLLGEQQNLPAAPISCQTMRRSTTKPHGFGYISSSAPSGSSSAPWTNPPGYAIRTRRSDVIPFSGERSM